MLCYILTYVALILRSVAAEYRMTFITKPNELIPDPNMSAYNS